MSLASHSFEQLDIAEHRSICLVIYGFGDAAVGNGSSGVPYRRAAIRRDDYVHSHSLEGRGERKTSRAARRYRFCPTLLPRPHKTPALSIRPRVLSSRAYWTPSTETTP